MATFYICRHGETFVTKEKRFWYGRRVFSAPILEEGKPALHRMGQYLKNIFTEANFSSPYLRCRQTSQIIFEETGKTFLFDKRLGEYLWEPFGHFRRRIKSFLKYIESQKYQHILICTHQAVITALIKIIKEGDVSPNQPLLDVEPGTLVIVEKGQETKVIDFNESSIPDPQTPDPEVL